jgi:hypothetical protein
MSLNHRKTTPNVVRFQVFTAASMNVATFGDIAPCVSEAVLFLSSGWWVMPQSTPASLHSATSQQAVTLTLRSKCIDRVQGLLMVVRHILWLFSFRLSSSFLYVKATKFRKRVLFPFSSNRVRRNLLVEVVLILELAETSFTKGPDTIGHWFPAFWYSRHTSDFFFCCTLKLE